MFTGVLILKNNVGGYLLIKEGFWYGQPENIDIKVWKI